MTNKIMWATWVEPGGDGTSPVFCAMKVADVIASEKARHKDHPLTPTLSDGQILDSFLAVHWASVKVLPENDPFGS